jgi:hypothetical protein
MAEIIAVVDAPYELLRLIKEACDQTPSIKKVIIAAGVEELRATDVEPASLSALNPNEGIIILDVANCVTDRRWVAKGFRFVANVFLNMVFGFYHELAHQFQIDDDPELLGIEEMPPELDTEANDMAEDLTLEWAKDSKVPKIADMGFAGQQILNLFNAIYGKAPEFVAEELKLDGTDAAAQATVATAVAESEDALQLITDIREGYIGVVVDGKEYFTAYEAINMNHEVKLEKEEKQDELASATNQEDI